MKLFSKNSNLCDHNPPTLQTDRQTTCDRNTALCTKVHGAVKINTFMMSTNMSIANKELTVYITNTIGGKLPEADIMLAAYRLVML